MKKLKALVGITAATVAAVGTTVAVAAPSHASCGYVYCSSTPSDPNVSATLDIYLSGGHDYATISGEQTLNPGQSCENLWLITNGTWTAHLMHKPYAAADYCTYSATGISDIGVTLQLAIWSPSQGKYLYTGSY